VLTALQNLKQKEKDKTNLIDRLLLLSRATTKID
jgi:hypothetical protein